MKKKIVTLALITLWIFLPGQGQADRLVHANARPAEAFHIYAMRYAQSRFMLKDIYASEKKSLRTVDFAWIFYLVTTKNRKILIDTGFSDAMAAAQYRITKRVHPADLLKKLGLMPADITDVILTHKHFDHCELVYLYTNANIFIQKEDYHALCEQHAHRPRSKIARFLRTCQSIQILNQNHSISPWIRIIRSGGHTRGSQIIIMETKDRPIIFPGDECYLIDGCVHSKPNSFAENTENNQKVLNQLKQAVQKKSALILTHHDPLICRSYPQIEENIFQIQ